MAQASDIAQYSLGVRIDNSLDILLNLSDGVSTQLLVHQPESKDSLELCDKTQIVLYRKD